ncbi:solute carrier family 25 member 48 isoform X2 [Callorhinchus milii]|uniref:solute carrier family 25 member 48 isoform X2 n=1 Tax=Callorhinchus milii TaxID=7868 RepID=UPI0004574E4B|nr:solute carrier family 25 member 48 isoform X2 [Callorhinchus milii]|eukprot:gi/632966604/ref/XP_007899511.1/ PREDICTED: solute carrier family 25 member 48 isoform X2 [Callorhinchus milii]
MDTVQLDDFLAGWIGGAASVIVGHPLDTVKARLQAGEGYKNTLQCVLRIFKNEHAVGFFKGLSFPLASVALYNSLALGVFSNTQRLICQYRYGECRQTPSLADLTAASAVVGLVTVTIGAPVDLVKIRLQMQTQPVSTGTISWGTSTPMDVIKSRLQADGVLETKYKGVLHCIRQSYHKEGLRVFFRGTTVNAIRGFPMSAAMFLGYELSLKAIRGQQTEPEPNT